MRRAGRLKWRGERVVGYLQRMGSLVMFSAGLKILEASWWWLLSLPIGFCVLWFIDKRYLFPGESEASFKENPEWNRVAKMVEEIHGKP